MLQAEEHVVDLRWPVVAGAVLVIGALVVGANVLDTARRSGTYAEYWRTRMAEPVAPGAVRLVALGDSSVEAIGAAHPLDGYVGRIARHVAARTGRPVHIANVSKGGTTADVLARQLRLVDLERADLVVVADANDMQRRVPPDRYRRDVEALARRLPADCTVYSDLPLMPGRGPYQAVLQHVTDARGIARADFARAFNGEGRRLDIFSWLPPHLNSRGYGYWYGAFVPAVDHIVDRMAPARAARPPQEESNRCSTSR
jgi:hypothetical protein